MAVDTSNMHSSARNLCFVNCGVKVELGGEDGGQFVKVLGGRDHPTSQGYVCNKAARTGYCHLRKPPLSATPGTLCEQDMHARIIEAMNIFDEGELDELKAAAAQGLAIYRDAFFAALGTNPRVGRMIPCVLYRTLGPALGEGNETTRFSVGTLPGVHDGQRTGSGTCGLGGP